VNNLVVVVAQRLKTNRLDLVSLYQTLKGITSVRFLIQLVDLTIQGLDLILLTLELTLYRVTNSILQKVSETNMLLTLQLHNTKVLSLITHKVIVLHPPRS
jgi:hypothetical protein